MVALEFLKTNQKSSRHIQIVLDERNKNFKNSRYYGRCKGYLHSGRSLHYPIALEGALKIKELAYIHAEGIAAGEIKHGPLALVEKNTFVIVINPSDRTHTVTTSSAYEIKARGATVIGISDKIDDVYRSLH